MVILSSYMPTITTWGFSLGDFVSLIAFIISLILCIRCIQIGDHSISSIFAAFACFFMFISVIAFSVGGEKEDGMIYKVEANAIKDFMELQKDYEIIDII